MKSVLITGASGFIGSFLVEEGLKRGFTVYAGIRKTSSRQYLKDSRIQFIEIDFSSTAGISGTLGELKKSGIRFDYIIHNAGLVRAKKKDDFFQVNYRNTKNFIEALVQSGMIPEKFIFISSLAAYGPGNPVTMKPVMLKDEPKPVDAYGKSKLEAEKYLITENPFPWLIIRPTGVYGPKEKDYLVFYKTINRGMETYAGSSMQVITFIYVKDLVRLIFDAMLSGISRKSYFVSDGKEYNTAEFAAIVKKALNKKTVRLTIPKYLVKGIAFALEKSYALVGAIPTLNTDKYKIISSINWRCETDPAASDFNFKPEYDLEKGVEEALNWYKSEGWM
jgi:nucleoside-diphosphate-sugar epimerase